MKQLKKTVSPTKKKKVALVKKLVTENHIYRRTDDKPFPFEIEMLEKSVYYAFKMLLEDDPTGKSPITYKGQPVRFKEQPADLAKLFKKIVGTYATM